MLCSIHLKLSTVEIRCCPLLSTAKLKFRWSCLCIQTEGGRNQSKYGYNLGGIMRSRKHSLLQWSTTSRPTLALMKSNICWVLFVYNFLGLYRLDELTAKLNDYTPDDPDLKSPSPEPIYDKDGRRLNIREVRKRDQLHRERVGLIEDCMKMRKTFVPP